MRDKLQTLSVGTAVSVGLLIIGVSTPVVLVAALAAMAAANSSTKN